MFFNPNPLIQALHIQAQLNTTTAKREATRDQFDQLHYELMHNLVIETTRMGIEVKNLKMRVESLTSRLEFNERRARALESVVVYKPTLKSDSGDRRRQHAAEPMTAASESRRQPRQRLRALGNAAAAAAAAAGGAAPDRPSRSWARQPRRPAVLAHGQPTQAIGARGTADLPEPEEASSTGQRVSSARNRSIEPLAGAEDTGKRRRRTRRRAVKLAVVVQRYGQAINGGAELHCALYRRASRAPRGGRGAHHVRDRLRHVAQRARGGRGHGERCGGSPLSRRS